MSSLVPQKAHFRNKKVVPPVITLLLVSLLTSVSYLHSRGCPTLRALQDSKLTPRARRHNSTSRKAWCLRILSTGQEEQGCPKQRPFGSAQSGLPWCHHVCRCACARRDRSSWYAAGTGSTEPLWVWRGGERAGGGAGPSKRAVQSERPHR